MASRAACCRRAAAAALVALAVACARPEAAVLTVAVVDGDAAVAGADVLLRRGSGGEVMARATTAPSGRAELPWMAGSGWVVQVLVTGPRGTVSRFAEVTGPELVVDVGGSGLLPELVGPPRGVVVARAVETPREPPPTRAAAVVEIDRSRGVPVLELSAPTRGGVVTLATILAEVGLSARVVWDEEIAPEELAAAGWPSCDAVRPLLERHRDDGLPGRGEWHFHLLLVPAGTAGLELSCLVDASSRHGSVVTVPTGAGRAAEALHAVAHELGHQLDLSHPWERGADVPSVMSYPWRWAGWDWADPGVFSFDPDAVAALERAGDAAQPGAGPFLVR